MPSLTFASVSKEFGDVTALRDLDLAVEDGELLVMVGPSGSGKSTALRVAAGLEEATAGTVWIGDRDVTRVAPSKRNVSMVFQSFALFPHLTVRDNVGFGLAARGMPRAAAIEKVKAAAELAGCDEFLDRRPFELSGGERQRVALARALAREPDAFLLDEPLSSLDAQLRVAMRAELKRLQRRLGATMLYVTHDQVEALTLGDRVAVLRDGALQQVGTPDDIYRRPANRFVATFVGSPAMNLVPAKVSQGRLRAGPFSFPIRKADSGLRGRPIELGIRPEHLEVSMDGRGTPARVELFEAAGDESYLYLESAGETLVARVPSDVRPAAGTQVRLQVRRANAYLFDAESGETLVQAG